MYNYVLLIKLIKLMTVNDSEKYTYNLQQMILQQENNKQCYN